MSEEQVSDQELVGLRSLVATRLDLGDDVSTSLVAALDELLDHRANWSRHLYQHRVHARAQERARVVAFLEARDGDTYAFDIERGEHATAEQPDTTSAPTAAGIVAVSFEKELERAREERKRIDGASGHGWKFGIVHPSDRALGLNHMKEEVWGADEPLLFDTAAEARARVAERVAQYPDGDWPKARVLRCKPGRPRVYPEWEWVGEDGKSL